MIHSIFLLYLIISANFLAQLFPCQMQNLLINNMILKHVFGFMTMIFFVVSTNADYSFSEMIKWSIVYYIWFLFSTKMNTYCLILFLLSLGVYYIVTLYRSRRTSQEEFLKKWDNWFLIYLFILTMLGCVIYLKEKQIEYKEAFTWQHFFFGTLKCKSLQ